MLKRLLVGGGCTNKDMELKLELPASQYIPGDTIFGTVCLNVHGKVAKRIESISVYFYGIEKLEPKKMPKSQAKLAYQHSAYLAKQSIFEVTILVEPFPKSFEPGAYRYPFHIVLSGDLPNSYRLSDEAWTADISYIMHAQVDYLREGFGKKTGHSQSEDHIVYLKSPPGVFNRPVNTIACKAEKNVRGCFFNLGSAELFFSMYQNQVTIKQGIQVRVCIDLSAYAATNFPNQVTFSIIRNVFALVDANVKVSPNTAIRTSVQIDKVILLLKPEQFINGVCDVSLLLNLPQGFCPSIRSTRLSCEYLVSVSVKLAMGKTIACSLPIEIYDPLDFAHQPDLNYIDATLRSY